MSRWFEFLALSLLFLIVSQVIEPAWLAALNAFAALVMAVTALVAHREERR